MKLLNYATSYLAVILFLVISVWATLFYFNMLDEIYDSMDDGLENQKLLVLQKIDQDSTILQKANFEEGYYKIKKLAGNKVKKQKDVYQDTLMYMQNEKDFEPVRMLKTRFRHHNRYYELRVITSMVEEDDLIEDLLYSLLWLYLGLIFSILVLNNLLLKKIWQPFYTILHRLQSFRLDNPQPFTPANTNISEFRILSQTAEQLLQSNINTYNSQKTFIENAAHELQTPLAVSLNKLELLIENNQLSASQLPQIGAVMQNLERLTRLNKALLLLSKIENKQFAATEEVNINTLVTKVMEDFADQAAFRHIRINLHEEDVCRQKLNPDLANILVVNLFKNALTHNYNGGFVNILIKKSELTMQNSGKETPLDHNKIYTRFYKDSAAPASTGLGLAIVKAITDLYNYRLTYNYQQQHILTLHFNNPE